MSNTNGTLKGRAIAGSYVVVLAWDFAEGAEAKREGLMGFAVERAELQGDAVVERYWMRSIKRFRDKDRGLAPGTPVSTFDHPVQSFQWADYTAEQDRQYRYTIVPMYGPIKNLQGDYDSGLELNVHTEIEYLLKSDEANDTARHDVYFNRGVIGSQAYARRFDNVNPKGFSPESREMTWLLISTEN
ncbi:hypothetical protein G6M70_04290 [Agrobacterium tumefaciens]|uniref:hypothetical protein n=1 Tax=Agrobacterium tumefaciens TaxID=358 RepID=UPI001572F07D|nr:hypothetical protein [Agrobacterium tumefaciens]NSZ04583.1 hypothetical protein [Agrobacterium tumefaciens]NSZ39919.1 hypothetical protein [Agrobacterium tumefaciens]NTB24837.1 hypothetical protein [Agrobacterium tumefaciens]NTB27667.1 hypothetical protein [Agrobacterium tumefaciens]NTB34238.1 hypothetical protein [Agrobacterium tumefaciens]